MTTAMDCMIIDRKTLPAEWHLTKLGEACELNPRRPELQRNADAATTFIPMPAVNGEYGIIEYPEKRPFYEVKKGYTYFAENDVLFAKITPCMQNGKHAIARKLIDGIGFGSTEFHVIRSNANLLPEWIHYFIRQPHILQDAVEHFTGAVGQQRVPDTYLAELDIPIPPIREQKRIVKILNEQIAEIDKVRASAQAQLEAAKALPSAYLRQAFPQPGQPLPSGWRWTELGEVADFIRGVNFCKADARTTSAEDYVIVLRAGNIQDMLVADKNLLWAPKSCVGQDQYLLQGDIVICMSSGSPDVVGKTAICKETFKASVGAFCGIIRTKKNCDSSYIASWFHSNAYEAWRDSQARGANIQNLRLSEISKISLPIPPLSEQRRISGQLAKQMTSAKMLQAEIVSQLNEINVLPAALLRQAFNGEL